MARWDDEEVILELETYPNAPCHTCVYRDRGDFGNAKGAANDSCEKYPVPRYYTGRLGKPDGILEGTKPCEYYTKETP